MDALGEDDVRVARETPPGVKLAQALELMGTGFRLKRAALRQQHPDAPEPEIERMFAEWLVQDD